MNKWDELKEWLIKGSDYLYKLKYNTTSISEAKRINHRIIECKNVLSKMEELEKILDT